MTFKNPENITEAVTSFDDEHWLREYGEIPKRQQQAIDEMDDAERENWIKEAMSALSYFMKQEQLSGNAG
jgi:hypothetical protein